MEAAYSVCVRACSWYLKWAWLYHSCCLCTVLGGDAVAVWQPIVFSCGMQASAGCGQALYISTSFGVEKVCVGVAGFGVEKVEASVREFVAGLEDQRSFKMWKTNGWKDATCFMHSGLAWMLSLRYTMALCCVTQATASLSNVTLQDSQSVEGCCMFVQVLEQTHSPSVGYWPITLDNHMLEAVPYFITVMLQENHFVSMLIVNA